MNKHEIKREESKNAIFNAARAIIAQRGFNGITLQDVLKEARVTKGKFFHYFNSKDELFSRLLRESLHAREIPSYGEIADKMEGKSPLEKLLGLLDYISEWHTNGLPEVMRLCVFATFFFSPDAPEVSFIRTALDKNVSVLRSLFAAAQEKGELPQNLDPEICGLILPSLTIGGNSVGFLSNTDSLTVKNVKEFKKIISALRTNTNAKTP